MSEDDLDDAEYSDDFAEDTQHDVSKSGPLSGTGGAGGSRASALNSAGSGSERQSDWHSESEGEEDPFESTQHDASKFSSMLSSMGDHGGAAGSSHVSARSASKDDPSEARSASKTDRSEARSASKTDRSQANSESQEDEQYSDSFEEDTALDSGPVTRAAARLTPRKELEMEPPTSRASSKPLSSVSSARGELPAIAPKPESPQAPASEEPQLVADSITPAQDSSDAREKDGQKQDSAARPAFTEEEIRALQQDAAPLPSDPEHWRADILGSGLQSTDFSRFAALGLPMPELGMSDEPHGKAISPGVQAPRVHDAVARHLKPHAWDLASLGQEAPPPRQAWPAEPPAHSGAAGWTLEPTGGGARGFGAKPSILPARTEMQLVDVLTQRFLEQRKAPGLEKRERAAYQDMLQQVAWTALEPASAHELASLLSRRSQGPVSSAEALRAFRRCLHAILTDDRVLDIIENQMVLHFSRLARPVH